MLKSSFSSHSYGSPTAGDVGAGGGVGPNFAAGAFAQVGDVTFGAYADGGSAVIGSLGGGAEYVLDADQDIPTFLVELQVGNATKPITGLANALIPGGNPIPTGPTPSGVFVDGTARVQVGGLATVGSGFISATAEAGAKAEVNHAVKMNVDDGTVSDIVTFSGEANAEAFALWGIPHISAWTAEGNAHAQASLQVETVFDTSGNPIEVIVTSSYGADADAHVAGDTDTTTIVTHQTSYDLTNPEVAAAISSLDENMTAAANGELPPALAALQEHGETIGPMEQQLTNSNFDARIGVGLGIGGSAGVNLNCLELGPATPQQS